jgi:hypothetical protein
MKRPLCWGIECLGILLAAFAIGCGGGYNNGSSGGGYGADAVMKGQYAFVASGFGGAVAGSITTDGQGHITGGVEDVHAPDFAGAGNDFTITSGSYSISSNNAGTFSYKDSNGNSFTFAVALGTVSNGVATRGTIIEFDNNQLTGNQPLETTGQIALQDASAFSTSAMSGTYAFALNGFNGAQQPNATIGSFTAGDGSFTNALFDQNSAAEGGGGGARITTADTFSATFSIDSNSRGVVTVTGINEVGTFAVYAVSAGEWFAIDVATDTDDYTGVILQQTGGPFTSSSINGTMVVQDQFASAVNAPAGMLGLFTSGGNGSASLSYDENNDGTVSLSQSSLSSISFTSGANGRFTISPAPQGASSELVGYMVAPNQAVFTSTDTLGPDFGTFEPQSGGPFSSSSANGSFFFGSLAINSVPVDPTGNTPPLVFDSGVVTLSSGNLSGTEAQNSSGTLNSGSGSISGTYTVASNGRVTTNGNVLLYIVSPTKAYLLDITSSSGYNPTIQVFQQ